MLGVILATVGFTAAISAYFGYFIYRDSINQAKNQKAPAVVQNQIDLEKAVAVIQTARGKIKIKFYPKAAPETVARVVELIQKGFYNGLTFHRVVPGFVVQGGDPTGAGTGGSGKKLPAEFNSEKHVPGAVGMARGADLNSADSQFYITLGTHPHLDGQYTVFGHVIEGLEVAEQLQVGDRMTTVTLDTTNR